MQKHHDTASILSLIDSEVGTPVVLTEAQEARLRELCVRYDVEFHKAHYSPQFDLPSGWVAGWIGGKHSTIFIGVSPEGDSHS